MELTISNESNGKTYYEPVVAVCRGQSQYNATQYSFEGLEGYWETGNQGALALGIAYVVGLATKLKGGNSQPGSMYRDVASVRMATPEESNGVPTGGGWSADIPDSPVQPHVSRNPPHQQYQQPQQAPAPQQPAPVNVNATPRVEGVVQGHVEKLAVDLYNAQRDISQPINYQAIREIRDAFFHQVKEKPIMSEHYCYDHEEPRREDSKQRWFHNTGDNFCMEYIGVMDSQGTFLHASDVLII